VLGEVLAERGMECDVLVPVPIHRARLRERGYNQAALIAEGMSYALQRPTMQALERRRYTGTQTSLGAMDRLRNLRDAIGLRVDANLRGSRVLLVDDVLTTGATLQACALPLIEGGTRRVDVATLAATI
jgi:competence protein ComFC